MNSQEAFSHQAGHDPEAVEKLLSQIEGSTAPILAGMVQGRFPPSDEERFRVSLFIAMQISRGWRFRHDVNALATLAARQHLPALVTDERIRRYLRQRGKASDPKAVGEFRRRILAEDAFTVHMTQPFAVQQALQFAIETFQPLLYFRTWRLLRFKKPLLLTSDNPVGLWTAATDEQQPSHGVGTAQAIFLPLGRQTALALVHRGSDAVATPGPVRARIINLAVASGAERWIFHHPSDQKRCATRRFPRSPPTVEGEVMRSLAGSPQLHIEAPVRALHWRLVGVLSLDPPRRLGWW